MTLVFWQIKCNAKTSSSLLRYIIFFFFTLISIKKFTCFTVQGVLDARSLEYAEMFEAIESRTQDYLGDWEKTKPVEGHMRPDEALQRLQIINTEYSTLKERLDVNVAIGPAMIENIRTNEPTNHRTLEKVWTFTFVFVVFLFTTTTSPNIWSDLIIRVQERKKRQPFICTGTCIFFHLVLFLPHHWAVM